MAVMNISIEALSIVISPLAVPVLRWRTGSTRPLGASVAKVAAILLALFLLPVGSPHSALAADLGWGQARQTYAEALRLEQLAQSGQTEKYEEARKQFLAAAEQAGPVAAHRPVDADSLSAAELRMVCLGHVGMETERRKTLDALLDGLPGNVPPEAAFAGVERIAKQWLGDTAFRSARLVRTPQYTVRVAPLRDLRAIHAAVETLARFADAYPRSEAAPKALLECLEIWYYDARETDAVGDIHERLLRDHPRSAEAVRADYLFGTMSFYLGDRAAALNALRRGGPGRTPCRAVRDHAETARPDQAPRASCDRPALVVGAGPGRPGHSRLGGSERRRRTATRSGLSMPARCACCCTTRASKRCGSDRCA